MSYSAAQITEKGNQPRNVKKSPHKTNKKFQHRRMRQAMKKLDFVPHFHKYESGFEQ